MLQPGHDNHHPYRLCSSALSLHTLCRFYRRFQAGVKLYLAQCRMSINPHFAKTAQALGNLKSLLKLSVVTRAISSTLTSFSSASFFAVSTTKAGSFRLPR